MVEALYFQTYFAYLKGNLSDARMFFEFMVEEFKKKKDPNVLTKKQLLQLKEIKAAIKTGKIETAAWITEENKSTLNEKGDLDIKQTELVRKIHFEGSETLRKVFKSEALELHNIEHPCGKYGAVDMVYRDQDTFYPIEVKRHEGKHDLIGQIAKYTFYFKLRLNLKVYSDVQPVTICNSYNPHTLTELKRMSVVTLKYVLRNDKIKIGII